MMTDNSNHDFSDAVIDNDIDDDDAPDAPTPTPPTIRADGWIPIRQRVFLESLAETGVVTQACDDCGMSTRAAYTLRLRDEGIGFRLGWEAAILIARGRLVDELMARAINGWEEVTTRSGDDENKRTRNRYDNRLAMSLLGRLDRRAEVPLTEGTDAALARIVAQDFEAYLDLISSGAGGAAVSLFVASRTPQIEAQNPPLNCAIGQCELCGADHSKSPETVIDEDDIEKRLIAAMRAWCHDPSNPEDTESWRTGFPAPPEFDGEEWGEWDDGFGYERTLTEAELAAQLARKYIPGTDEAAEFEFLRAAEAARDAYFGFAAGEVVTAE
jgi:hypothetical protein